MVPLYNRPVTFKLIESMAVRCPHYQNTAKVHKTSTGQYHRFIPVVSQEFDCRVKANIKQESLHRDLAIKNEELQSTYNQEYFRKSSHSQKCYRVPPATCIDYLRTVEEKLFEEPPPPLKPELSLMKDSYRFNYIKTGVDETIAPTVTAKCLVTKLGIEEQPGIIPQKPGFWKWTDPYLTTYKSEYIPYDDVDEKIKGETLTFYNESKFELPPGPGNKVIFDRSVFRYVPPLKMLPRIRPKVPHYGLQSEYEDRYRRHTFSKCYPYIRESCLEFEDSLPPASRWQDLMAPGMYCSEYCNYGSGSVRRYVAPDAPKKEIKRTPNCCRLYLG